MDAARGAFATTGASCDTTGAARWLIGFCEAVMRSNSVIYRGMTMRDNKMHRADALTDKPAPGRLRAYLTEHYSEGIA